MTSQRFRECWYRFIGLSSREKLKFAHRVGLYDASYEHDPVHYVQKEDRKSGWYFWDEIWYDTYGPYITEKKARDECRKYCDKLEEQWSDNELSNEAGEY